MSCLYTIAVLPVLVSKTLRSIRQSQKSLPGCPEHYFCALSCRLPFIFASSPADKVSRSKYIPRCTLPLTLFVPVSLDMAVHHIVPRWTSRNGSGWSSALPSRRALNLLTLLLSFQMAYRPACMFGQVSTTHAGALLPDAPQAVPLAHDAPKETSVQSSAAEPQPAFKIGPWRDPKSLNLSMPVVPLTVADKLKLSFQEQLTPFALVSTVFAASWEQLVNSNPKYGSNSTAFAQRVGAAALRQTSQAVLSDGVFASVFHQDPRYYRLAGGSLGKEGFLCSKPDLPFEDRLRRAGRKLRPALRPCNCPGPYAGLLSGSQPEWPRRRHRFRLVARRQHARQSIP